MTMTTGKDGAQSVGTKWDVHEALRRAENKHEMIEDGICQRCGGYSAYDGSPVPWRDELYCEPVFWAELAGVSPSFAKVIMPGVKHLVRRLLGEGVFFAEEVPLKAAILQQINAGNKYISEWVRAQRGFGRGGMRVYVTGFGLGDPEFAFGYEPGMEARASQFLEGAA